MTSSPISWPALASAIAAWAAFVLALCSLLVARRALHIAEAQARRREPRVVAYLQNGYFRDSQKVNKRTYAFLLLLSNTSDSDNSVAAMDLRVTYADRDGILTTIRIPSNQLAAEPSAPGPVLHTPVRIDAHQSVTGWCYFVVQKSILEDKAIEGYSIALADSHGIETSVKPVLIQDYSDAAKDGHHQA